MSTMKSKRAEAKAMVKVLTQTWAFLILSVCLADAQTDREKASLNGSVRTVIQQSSTWQKGAIVESSATTYDAEGNEIKAETSNYRIGEDQPLMRESSVYSSDNKKNRKEITSYKEDGSISGRSVSAFDFRGNRTEFVAYDAHGLVMFRFVDRYDDKGRNIETISYKSENIEASRSFRSYDKNGNAIDNHVYKGDGLLDYRVLSKYDEKGKRIEENFYDKGGKLDEKRVFRYDDKTHLLEKTSFKASGELKHRETYSYEFDAVGNWTKRTTSKWVVGSGGDGYFEVIDIIAREIGYVPAETNK